MRDPLRQVGSDPGRGHRLAAGHTGFGCLRTTYAPRARDRAHGRAQDHINDFSVLIEAVRAVVSAIGFDLKYRDEASLRWPLFGVRDVI